MVSILPSHPPLISLYSADWQFALFCCFLGGVCPSPPHPRRRHSLLCFFGQNQHTPVEHLVTSILPSHPYFFLWIALIGNLRCISLVTSSLCSHLSPTWMGRWEKFNRTTFRVDSCYRNIWYLSSSSLFGLCNGNHFAPYPAQYLSNGHKFISLSFQLIFDLLFTKLQMYYITMDYKIRYLKITATVLLCMFSCKVSIYFPFNSRFL